MQKKSHNLELKISNNKILCLLWKFSFSECSNMILWLDMFKRQTVRRGGNMSQVSLAVMIINNTRVGWIWVN